MSSAFDIVQHSLITLSKEENLTREQRTLLAAVERTISEWHELNHKQRDVINLKTPPGSLVAVLDTERLVLGRGECPSPAPQFWPTGYLQRTWESGHFPRVGQDRSCSFYRLKAGNGNC